MLCLAQKRLDFEKASKHFVDNYILQQVCRTVIA